MIKIVGEVIIHEPDGCLNDAIIFFNLCLNPLNHASHSEKNQTKTKNHTSAYTYM